MSTPGDPGDSGGVGGMGGWGERDGGRSRHRDIMSENVIVNKKKECVHCTAFKHF